MAAAMSDAELKTEVARLIEVVAQLQAEADASNQCSATGGRLGLMLRYEFAHATTLCQVDVVERCVVREARALPYWLAVPAPSWAYYAYIEKHPRAVPDGYAWLRDLAHSDALAA